jgi:hypothetical protein
MDTETDLEMGTETDTNMETQFAKLSYGSILRNNPCSAVRIMYANPNGAFLL